MNGKPLLSLVTGTINRPDGLERLIQSVVQNTVVDYELVVMDASPQLYDRDVPKTVRLFRESPRKGHIKGYNQAFNLCRGEYVLWLNDDATVNPGYDTAGVKLLMEHPEVGMGAYYYHQNGKYHVNLLYNMIFANFGILRRSLGDQVGWFDEEIGVMYGSDNSLTFRVLLAGYGLATVPGRNIIHHSVMDEMRIENERLRRPDADKLFQKYAPYVKQMADVYKKTIHLVGPRVI